MAVSVNWATKVITIPQADLTLVSGTIYELDTNWFRLQLKDLEDGEIGMPYIDTHSHNTQVTVAGIVYARTIEIINGYSVTFEDGQYTVILKGSNNNIFDVENGILNQNQVQIIPTNAAGLIVHTVISGSGVTEQDKDDIAEKSRVEMDDNSTELATIKANTENIDNNVGTLDTKIDSIAIDVELLKQMETGRWELDIVNNQMIFYADDNVTEIMRFNMLDANDNPTTTSVFKRTRV